MKNMVKLFGNPNRACRRQAKVPLLIISLAAIISFAALSLTGCDDGGGGNPTAPTITTATLPKGRAGMASYTATLAASGTAPITWSIESDTLPTGLSLSGNTISGTPTVPGTSTFTVTATNAAGSNDKELSIIITPSGKNMNEAIPLTVNEWEDGNLPTPSDEQWFSFTATASTQYIHAAFGTLTILYVQVYDSNGNTVGNEPFLSSSRPNISRTLVSGQTYYIKVRPSYDNGTYRIGFNSTLYPPGISPIPLTVNEWEDGNLPTGGQQWFSFTATANTQWIHADFDFGTLSPYSGMVVQVYDSSGNTVGSETSFDFTTTSTSRTLTVGQTYYIRVRTSYDNGTYRIGFNAATTAPPIQLPSNAIPLTVNTWTNGNLPTSRDMQWFSFTATASTQWIHIAGGTLFVFEVQVYDSSGTVVGSGRETSFNISTTFTSRRLTVGQTYYIRVRTYSNGGTYRIMFNTTFVPPGVSPIPLTVNTWTNGNLPTSRDMQWFSFTATASTQWIHVSFGTLTNLYVKVYNSSGETVGSETNLWSSTTSISRSLTSGQTYYIMVRPYSNGGTYRIQFNTTAIVVPSSSAISLTNGQWEDGNLPTPNDVQWFKFIATTAADTVGGQHIYVSGGTLYHLEVQVQAYNSNGTAVGVEQSSATISWPTMSSMSSGMIRGQTYYIRVRPYNSSYSGTYKIAFNDSQTPPPTQ